MMYMYKTGSIVLETETKQNQEYNVAFCIHDMLQRYVSKCMFRLYLTRMLTWQLSICRKDLKNTKQIQEEQL